MEHIQTIALTPGAATALQDKPADLQIGQASQLLSAHWNRGGNLLVIGAIGAVTRLVAPLAQDKHSDPAVVVVDARGEHVVPLWVDMPLAQSSWHAIWPQLLEAEPFSPVMPIRKVAWHWMPSARHGVGRARRSQRLASADAIPGHGATAEPGSAERNNALVHQCWQPTAQSSGWSQPIGRLEHRG